MQLYPQTTNFRELRQSPSTIVARTSTGPVFIIGRDTAPKAVLVSPEEWEKSAKRLAELEHIVHMDNVFANGEFTDITDWLTELVNDAEPAKE